MCECYQIGGPWITFDPDCPAHGLDAQRAKKETEARESEIDERISRLERQVSKLCAIRDIADEAANSGDALGLRIVQIFDA